MVSILLSIHSIQIISKLQIKSAWVPKARDESQAARFKSWMTSHWLYDVGEITYLLCASVSLSRNGYTN